MPTDPDATVSAKPAMAVGADESPASEAAGRPRGRAAVSRRRGLLASLGPGLITGAADDDPSGIATYSQVGAQFGYGLTWTMPFTFLLLASIQEISARLGLVTGRGLAANLRDSFPRPLLLGVVTLLTIANVFNLGADLGAMAEAVKLLVSGPGHVYVVLLGLGCAWAQIVVPYKRYVRVLKWLTLSLFAYVATAFAVDAPWGEVALRAIVPQLAFDRDLLVGVVAVFGTTLSPYLIFWQAAEEAEDLAVEGRPPLRSTPHRGLAEIRRIRLDTYVGIGFSNLIGLFIIVTSAATLHHAGIAQISTAAQAAEALRPLAGPFAFAAFAAGIVGTGLLAVPVLAGSAAYAVAEATGRRVGLSLRPKDGRVFYGVIGLATLIGMAIHFVPIDPMRFLYWSAILNGVIVVPIMAVLMIVASRGQIMGRFALPAPLRLAGWVTTAVMGLIVLAMLVALGR